MKRTSPVRAQNRRRRLGFTLLELLIVLAIIGVIAAMVVPRLFGTLDKSKINATKTSIEALEHTIDLYRVDNGYPTAISDLMQTVDKDGREIDPFLDKIPRDAWGNELHYEAKNTKAKTSRPAIWSSGPDGQDDNGGNDDINNWSDLVQQ
ncbi:MAG: type II secretion system major pseudopilin GspG [Planctomycetaceae bacterium]